MSDREEEEDDDVPQLSAAALAALQEFYAESEAGHAVQRRSYTVGTITEDWVSVREPYSCAHVHNNNVQSRHITHTPW